MFFAIYIEVFHPQCDSTHFCNIHNFVLNSKDILNQNALQYCIIHMHYGKQSIKNDYMVHYMFVVQQTIEPRFNCIHISIVNETCTCTKIV